MKLPFTVSVLLSLSFAACGDDGSNGSDPEDAGSQDARVEVDAKTQADAGSSSVADAARVDGAAPDAAGPVDAAAELARALQREGVQTDTRRQQLVFEAWCRNEIKCGYRDAADLPTCVDEQSQSFAFTLLGDQDCVDSTLDQLACHVRATCDDLTECFEAYPASVTACEEIFGMMGME